jgi:threonyl-tRNA synthetase
MSHRYFNETYFVECPGAVVAEGEKAEKTRPIMVHRAIFGSLERFFGVLLESSAGDFPLW